MPLHAEWTKKDMKIVYSLTHTYKNAQKKRSKTAVVPSPPLAVRRPTMWMMDTVSNSAPQSITDILPSHTHTHTRAYCIAGRCPTASDERHKYSYIHMIAEM